MSRRSRWILFISVAVLAPTMWACGNTLEGGSSPSGSVLHITDFELSSAFQDLYFCEGSDVSYVAFDVTIRNDSRPNFEDNPNSPDGTNSRVTMYRYRVDYSVLNMTGTIPSFDGAGFSGTIDPDGTIAYDGFLLITESQLEYIRSNYPDVGNGKSMNVRADVTFWGKDEFQVEVTVEHSASFIVDDFDPCSSDLPPPDESSL
jgi:hypothetical protein